MAYGRGDHNPRFIPACGLVNGWDWSEFFRLLHFLGGLSFGDLIWSWVMQLVSGQVTMLSSGF